MEQQTVELSIDDPAPPSKRRRLSSAAARAVNGDATAGSNSKKDGTRAPTLDRFRLASQLKSEAPARGLPQSVVRTVSPPTTRMSEPSISTTSSVPAASSTTNPAVPVSRTLPRTPANKFNLMPVKRAPALFNQRMDVLKLLWEGLERQNEHYSKLQNAKEEARLHPDELRTFALELEHEYAETAGTLYKQSAGRLVLTMKKKLFGAEEWEAFVLPKFVLKHNPLPKQIITPPAISTKSERWLPSLSEAQSLAVLPELKCDISKLTPYDYVPVAPSELDVQKALLGVMTAGGHERCDRCNSNFQVFPGRNAEGLLTTRGPCRYHSMRLSRQPPAGQGRGRVHRNDADSLFPCCEALAGSEGCRMKDSHVFKVSDVKRLASQWQFMSTPAAVMTEKMPKAVVFDCEMGYTTLGMELIRLTACNWPDGNVLIDVLVRPIGEVLDLNTEFSGVTVDQFISADPYGEDPPKIAKAEVVPTDEVDMEDGEIDESPQPEPKSGKLRKVDSPQAARDLLFTILTPSTPLLGHALENDLNVCRIIHPFLVDTSLLFKHHRPMPIRHKLKHLAKQYLGISIQGAGTNGHDSTEDAQATGDLVRFKAEKKWFELKLAGWEWNELFSELVPPKTNIKGTIPIQEPSTAVKRKNEEIN